MIPTTNMSEPCMYWEKLIPKEPEPEPPTPPESVPEPHWVSTCQSSSTKTDKSEPIRKLCVDELHSDPSLGSVDSLLELDLEEEQLHRLEEAFVLCDNDKDGLLDTKELGRVMRALGQKPTESDIVDTVAEYAHESCDKIDLKGFTRFMSRRLTDADDDYELREAFRRFDRPGRGLVNSDVLRQMLTTLGEPLTHEEVDTVYMDGEEHFTGADLDYEALVTDMLTR